MGQEQPKESMSTHVALGEGWPEEAKLWGKVAITCASSYLFKAACPEAILDEITPFLRKSIPLRVAERKFLRDATLGEIYSTMRHITRVLAAEEVTKVLCQKLRKA